MIWMGPISSAFDILTFILLYFVIVPMATGQAYAHGAESATGFIILFQTGWFIESMWSQTMVIHMLRSAKLPFLQSRPSWFVLGTTLTGLARSVKSDIDACYEALKDAKHPQIHVFIATSPIHRKYKLNKSKEEILEAIKEHVSYARSKFEIVEFSPEDATRTELDFLLQVVQTAVDAGASYINIPDTVGFTTPEEFARIFDHLTENIKSDHKVVFGVHCHDDLGMATANTLTAIKHGAGRVQGTINGIGERAGNVALEEVAVALKIREDFFQATSDIVLDETMTRPS